MKTKKKGTFELISNVPLYIKLQAILFIKQQLGLIIY